MSSQAIRSQIQRTRFAVLRLAIACSVLFCIDISAQTLDLEADHAGFAEIAEPFFERYCLRCHGPDEDNGDLRMDRLGADDFASRPRAARWRICLSAR